MSNFINKLSLLQNITIAFMLSSLLITSGCDILLPAGPLPATATPTPTLTPTPTIDWFPPTPTPTLVTIASPTPEPTRSDQREGITEMLIEDHFTDESLWTAPQSESGNAAFGADNLTLAVAKQNSYVFSLSRHDLRSNFYLEITIQTSLCQPEDQFGIMFWHQSTGNTYQILFNCSGEYRLELLQGGQAAVIHDWETASQMQPSHPATNRIGMWVYQGRFQLYINNAFQFEEQITQDRSGNLGVFARTISGNAMTIRFSELQIFRVESD